MDSEYAEMLQSEDDNNEQAMVQQIETETTTVEELLISLVSNRPSLLTRLPIKNRSKIIREAMWTEIYEQFGSTEEFSIDFLSQKSGEICGTPMCALKASMWLAVQPQEKKEMDLQRSDEFPG